LMIDPNDVEAWTVTLRRVLEDAALRGRLRQAGLARAAQFSWTRTAEQTLAVYRKAVAA